MRHSVLEQLDRAENSWRDTVRVVDPAFYDLEVEKADPDPNNKRHWMFYTEADSNVLHMDVFKPDVIEKTFRKVIQKMYRNSYGEDIKPSDDLVRRLVHDTFTYLYFHEQFHPTYCPNSDTDQKAVDKALYEGIKAAIPHLDKAKILGRIGNCRNAVWDQVIDTGFFYLANYGNSIERRLEDVLQTQSIDLKQYHHLPDGVVPIFDVVEFEVTKKENFDSMFYPISRSIYAMLFNREHEMRGLVFDYFRKIITKNMQADEFDLAVRSAIRGIADQVPADSLNYLRVSRNRFHQSVDELCANYGDAKGDAVHEGVISDVYTLFIDKRTRYDAIRGFIMPLAKYISDVKEEKRHGTHIGQGGGQGQPGQGQPGQDDDGSGGKPGDQQTDVNQPGGNAEQALQNLADVLDPDEVKDLLQSIINAGGTGAGPAGKNRKLFNLARDEYYKRNVKDIMIKSPDYEAVSVDMGKKEIPVLVGSSRLTTQEVVNLNLDEIMQFYRKTGIPQLFQLSPYEFRLDHYEWHEVDDVDYRFENTGLILPKNLVFHVDSSSSMGSPNYVNTGCKYDVLMHHCFGILKTLRKAADEMNEEIYVITSNFSNGTIVSDAVEIRHMYDTPNNSAKLTLMGFQAGGTEYTNSQFGAIDSMLKPGRTAHVWISDGQIAGDTQGTLAGIRQSAMRPESTFLYFEIGTSSSFGSSVQSMSHSMPNIKYHPNAKIKDVQDGSLEVLLEYSS